MNPYLKSAEKLLAMRAMLLQMGESEAGWLASVMLDVEHETRERIAKWIDGDNATWSPKPLAEAIRKGEYRGDGC